MAVSGKSFSATRNPLAVLAVAVFIFFGINISGALAGKAALTWNANSESDLAGYKIYYGTAKRTASSPGGNLGGYQNVVDAQKVTAYAINNLAESNKYYFSITAYDTSGNESGFSAEAGKVFGDVNYDGKVDIFDYNTFAQNFGASGSNASDVDGNGTVNIFDYNIFAQNFGKNL